MRMIIAVSLISIVFLAGIISADSWHIETVDIGYAGCSTSIAIDTDDNPHISYYVYTDHDLKYAYFNGNSWEITSVDTTGWVGEFNSIALDSDDNPHISYFNETNYDLKYAYFNGASWEITSVDTTGYVGQWTSIALDSNDNPHISYFDGYNDNLKYAFFNGTYWEVASIDTAEWVGEFTSIALDSNDNAHISYYDCWPNYDLKYAGFNGTSWEITTVDAMGSSGYYTSIALDSNDNPHISYHDEHTEDLKYTYFNGTSWEIVWVDIVGSMGEFNSIILDSGDNPHISYFDEIECDLKYAYFNGTSWEITSVDTTGWVGLWTSIALDSDDNPHISYYDGSNNNLKYAWYGEPHQVINLTTFSAVDKGGKAIVLNWSVETTEGETIEGFNLYRRVVGVTNTTTPVPESENTHSLWIKVNEHLITGQNPYSYIDDTVEIGITYEYRLEAVVEEEPTTLGTTQGTCGLPTSFAITSIHPNPTTDEVSITLSTPEKTDVKIEVYDITGRLVMEREVGEIESGEHTEILSTSDLSSGVYTVKVTAGVEQSTEMMVVVR